MEYNINFLNQNLTVRAKEGTILSKVCEKIGLSLDLVCGGKGTCGKCKVKLIKDNKLVEVLACQTVVRENIRVLMEEYHSMDISILTSNIENYQFNPHVRKIYLEKKELQDRKDELLEGCDLYLLKKFSKLYNSSKVKGITLVKYEDNIIDLLEGDRSEVLYGAAVDIGTTTLVIYIYDLITGKLLTTLSDLNGQVSMGADLISRIDYGSKEEGLKELNKKIISTLNKLLLEAKEQLPDLLESLYHLVLCGNTLMHHLFLGLSPEGLGRSPFEGITKDLIECWGSETEIICAERCKIEFLPLLGGFVGADMAALMLTVEEGGNKLIIDLGTNGEIAVGNINEYYVTSAACGPAFEGGNIQCGMRASLGAIEGFKIEKGEILLSVVGNTEPKGICGSGIIDIVAELLRNNIIDNRGRMRSYDEFAGINPYSKLKDRIQEIDGINSFVIYKPASKDSREGAANEKAPIYISQKDIRQIQLSKSSIYSSIITILELWGKRIDEIDEVILAGSFGNYINAHNAQYIGLLPKSKGKVKVAGNGAGKGVCLYLLNKDMKEKLRKITKNTKHFQLGDKELFADNYIKNMDF